MTLGEHLDLSVSCLYSSVIGNGTRSSWLVMTTEGMDAHTSFPMVNDFSKCSINAGWSGGHKNADFLVENDQKGGGGLCEACSPAQQETRAELSTPPLHSSHFAVR